jgi:CubicO group peptidase (beta-lactamase class C family)
MLCRGTSRRAILIGLAASATSRLKSAQAAPARADSRADDDDHAFETSSERDPAPGPVFVRGGPDSMRYGEAGGYAVPERRKAVLQGNPWAPEDRVGAFSHLDEIYPTRRIARSEVPSAFKRSTFDVTYVNSGQPTSLKDYLSRRPITGLLIAKDDQILFEGYQYGRTDSDRLLGQSMTKSITGLLVGLAVADGALGSIDDLPETYVPEFKGSEYGRTPLRALLHMSSGVDFGEERDDGRDLSVLWRDMVLGAGFFAKKSTVQSIRQFNRRIAAPGARFRYASIEPDVLAVVLRAVLGRSLSDYLREKLWSPLGTEADATWLVDAEGLEVGHFGFSAVLRDYARLGRLLACNGAWDGVQLIPAPWLHDATTIRTSEDYLAPGRSMKFGYGYLLWLLPGDRRQFALVGQNGQRICVDPKSRIVMVQTALEDVPEAWVLWEAVTSQLA